MHYKKDIFFVIGRLPKTRDVIKPLFRGLSKHDPHKVIVIHKASVGNLQKFLKANSAWMAIHKVNLYTRKKSYWISALKNNVCFD